MRPLKLLAATASLALALPAVAAGLSVNFVHPEHYTDAAYSRSMAGERERAEVQRDMEQHLRLLAQRGLAESDTLQVDVLDIDLAGRFNPFSRTGSNVRIVSDIAGPRIQLRYSLSRGGQVAASGEDHLSDLNFLLSGGRYSSADPLRYEKALLDTWFDKRIAAAAR